MRITCPSCGFSRDMPEDRIPSTARLATCPKCSHKFRLRKEEDSFLLEDDTAGERERAPPPDPGAIRNPFRSPTTTPRTRRTAMTYGAGWKV